MTKVWCLQRGLMGWGTDPVHQRIMKTPKRLREEEDYDDDDFMQYAIKKRKFLIERKLNEYDPPSYEEDEEQARTLSLPYKAPVNMLPYKAMNSKKKVMKTVIKVLEVDETQTGGPNPLFHRSSHS